MRIWVLFLQWCNTFLFIAVVRIDKWKLFHEVRVSHFPVVNDAVPDYCPFVWILFAILFLSKTIIFFCHFFIAQTMRNLTGCYTNIKPHCCSLSNIKTLVLSCIEQILITIEYYSDIDIWYLCYNFDIKLLSFIFLMIWPEAFRGLLGQQWFLDLPLVLVIGGIIMIFCVSYKCFFFCDQLFISLV